MPGRPGRPFDRPGFLSLSVGLFALLLAFDKGQAWGWTRYSVLVCLCVGLDLVVLFVAIELRTADPLLDVRVFTCRPFTVSVTLVAILAVELFSALFHIPLFLVEGQQATPELAGLVLMPQALTLVVMMPIAGRVYDRVGPRWPALVGLTLTAAGTLPLTGLSPRGGPYVDPDAELAPVPGRQLLLRELTQRDLQAHAYRPVSLVVACSPCWRSRSPSCCVQRPEAGGRRRAAGGRWRGGGRWREARGRWREAAGGAGPLGLIGLYLRYRLEDPPAFRASSDDAGFVLLPVPPPPSRVSAPGGRVSGAADREASVR